MLTPRIFDQITLDAGTTTNNFPRGYQVQISNDGTSWTDGHHRLRDDGAGDDQLSPAQTARHIRINQTATNSATWSIQEMNVTGPTLSQPGWVATASVTGGTNVAANAIDGSATTRWTTGVAQAPARSSRSTWGRRRYSTSSRWTPERAPTTTPAGIRCRCRTTERTGARPVATGTGTTQLVTIYFPTQTARHFRIVQTATRHDLVDPRAECLANRAAVRRVTCTAPDTCHVAGVCDPDTRHLLEPERGRRHHLQRRQRLHADRAPARRGRAPGRTRWCARPATSATSPARATRRRASARTRTPPTARAATTATPAPQTSTCQTGTCTGSNPVVCYGARSVPRRRHVQPGDGRLLEPERRPTARCNDGNAARRSSTCQAGDVQRARTRWCAPRSTSATSPAPATRPPASARTRPRPTAPPATTATPARSRHLPGRHVHGLEPGGVHGQRPVPRRRHVQPGDGHLLEPDRSERDGVRRRQRLYYWSTLVSRGAAKVRRRPLAQLPMPATTREHAPTVLPPRARPRRPKI